MNLQRVVVAAQSFGHAEPEGAKMLEQAGFELYYLPGLQTLHQELSEAMQDKATVAVIAGAEAITAEMIKASPNLRIIAMHGVGLDRIDCQAAQECGVIVKAVPGGNAPAVADLTWGLMLAVARHIAEADQAVRAGDWSKKFIGSSLNEKTLGVIGFGAVGRAVARRASGFDMTVLTYDVVQDQAFADSLKVKYVQLDELLTRSDFITLHVPLIPATTNLIGESEFQMMKPNTILINISRGGIVDEQALCRALVEKRIAGAGVDVFCEEPLPLKHCLLSAPNCVLTSHIGARTRETVRYIGIETAKNIIGAFH